MHVHLRQDAMMEFVAPLIANGGCDAVYVMPNLQPPITKVTDAILYHQKLTSLVPNVKFLMSLYLHPDITPEVISEASKTGVVYGVKYYPTGVTTNSAGGVLNIEQYYPVFAAMEKHDIVLNLHGEMINSPPTSYSSQNGPAAVTVLNAEPRFLPQLFKLHTTFPNLRIILEHVSTREGLDAVRKCGPLVAGTITAHHLWMTVDDWCGDVFNFCKPVAKTPEDRVALVKAIVDGSGKFFFGSDSAPHPRESKKGQSNTAAGCFTQPWCTALVIGALEEAIEHGWIAEEEISQEALEGFLSHFGRAYYKLSPPVGRKIRLERKGERIPERMFSPGDKSIEIVPFNRGKEVMSLSWVAP